MSDRPFQPARLRLARELNSWTQTDLARNLGITGAAVSQFESGAARPNDATLGRLGEILEVPSEFFSLPMQDVHEGFFRSLRRTPIADRRRARAFAHIAHDAATGDPAATFPRLTLPSHPLAPDAPDADAEEIAGRVRTAWKVPAGPIENVVQLLEDHGIVVIRLPLSSAEVDAFSLPFLDHPVVVLGTDKNDRGRSRFDAAHELGHLVMHGEQVWGLAEVEKQAHAFAAAFLMPRADIEDELPTRGDWLEFFQLKTRWQVSLAALLRRANTLKRMTDENYLAAIKAASARGWRRVEPIPLGAPEEPTRLRALLELADARTSVLPQRVVHSLIDAVA